MPLARTEPRNIEAHDERRGDDRHDHHRSKAIDHQRQQPLGEHVVDVAASGRTNQQRNEHAGQRAAEDELIDGIGSDVRRGVGIQQPSTQPERGHQRQRPDETGDSQDDGGQRHRPPRPHKPGPIRHGRSLLQLANRLFPNVKGPAPEAQNRTPDLLRPLTGAAERVLHAPFRDKAPSRGASASFYASAPRIATSSIRNADPAGALQTNVQSTRVAPAGAMNVPAASVQAVF